MANLDVTCICCTPFFNLVSRCAQRMWNLNSGRICLEAEAVNSVVCGGQANPRGLLGRRAVRRDPLPPMVVGAVDGHGQEISNFGGLV